MMARSDLTEAGHIEAAGGSMSRTVEVMIILGLVVIAGLLVAMWLELRNLQLLVREILASNREHSHSMLAAAHEIGAAVSRSRASAKEAALSTMSER